MTRVTTWTLAVSVIAISGCAPSVDDYIRMVDAKPADERPPGWEDVKTWMARRAPAVNEKAPDFTLPTDDGDATITRSDFHENRPLVLIFGSYT
ncbi:MAG: hypothetical protein HOP29_15805 [Phycisphaerales bacterium]|nr:hypothetical protein [Phycisphaerales bacterium]